jgi:hydrogenase maturation factor
MTESFPGEFSGADEQLAIEGNTPEAFARKVLRTQAMAERILEQTELDALPWVGEGVQIAAVHSDQENETIVLLRSRAEPEAPVITYTVDEWITFRDGTKEGDFDDL